MDQHSVDQDDSSKADATKLGQAILDLGSKDEVVAEKKETLKLNKATIDTIVRFFSLLCEIKLLILCRSLKWK